MITLNLLPYSRRKEIEVKKGEHFILFFGVIFLFFFLMTIALMMANTILIKKVIDLAMSGVVASDIQSQAEELNRKIFNLNQVQNKFILYTDSLVNFSEIVSPGIKIGELDFNGVEGSVRVRGVALTQDDLDQFKKKLEDSERFLDVKVLAENNLPDGQIGFEIVAKVNFSKLK